MYFFFFKACHYNFLLLYLKLESLSLYYYYLPSIYTNCAGVNSYRCDKTLRIVLSLSSTTKCYNLPTHRVALTNSHIILF